MDILQEEERYNYCKKHPSKQLQFINLNHRLDNEENLQSIYFCEICLMEDDSLQIANLLSVKQIIEQGEDHIIQKWPPVNSNQVLKDLIQEMKGQQKKDSIESYIINYFQEMKEEILGQIDFYVKKIISQLSDIPFEDNTIITNYQSISKIDQLRSILIENQKNDMYKLQELKELIHHFQAEKDKNTLLLQNLLDQCESWNKMFDFSYLNSFKDSLMAQIKKLDVFGFGQQQEFGDSQEGKYSSLLLKLISNKSNFCSEEFLSEISQPLLLLDPMLQSLNNIQIMNYKQPIQFELLEREEIELINKQVEHNIKLNQSEQYESEVSNSELIQYLSSQISENSSDNFLKLYKNYLIETFPYLLHFVENQNQGLSFSEYLKADSMKLKSNSIISKAKSSKEYEICFVNLKLEEQKITKFAFRIINLANWIAVGVCFSKRMILQSFQFDPFEVKHGGYLISKNGYTWSHYKESQQQTKKSFTFTTGDIIYVEFYPLTRKLKFKKQSSNKICEMDIYFDKVDDLVPCVCLFQEGDEVEILNSNNQADQILIV